MNDERWSLILISLLIVLSLVLAACGATPEPEKPTEEPKAPEATKAPEEPKAEVEPVTVEVWFHSGKGEERDVLDAQVETFNNMQNEVFVDAVRLPEGSYNEQVSAAALAGDLPDLLDFDGPFLYNYAWAGHLMPIDEFVSDDLKNDFLPSIIDQGTYGGNLYSLGTFDSGLAIWGNKAYLEKAGVRIPTGIDDAWSLDEFNDALEKLQALDEVEYAIDLKMNYGQGEWYTYGFSPIIQSWGGDLIDRSDYQSADGVLNGPEAVEAMEWFQSLFDNGYANAEPAGDDDFYGTKKAALAFVGHWMWTPHSEGLGDDLVLLPMPKLGDKAATGMGSWNWGITSHSEHPDAAWKFLEFLVDPDEILHMTNANGAVPARKSALAKSDLFGEGGPLNVFVQQLEGGVAIPRPITPAYPTITESYAEAVQNIVTGADVQAELDKVVKEIDQDIEDNQGYPVPGAPPPEPKAEGEPVTINVWFHSGKGEERDVLDAQVETFNNMQNEVFVDAVRLPEGSYNEQVSAAALAGDLPDLLDFDGPFLYNYAWAGHLMPIDEFVSDDLKNDFLPSIIDQGTYGGNLYSLGTFDSGLAIWGNKAYLEKAGVRIPTGVDDAWSLDEFNDALEKLQALDEVEYAIDLKMNYGQGEWYTYGFSPIIQSWGGDLIDRSDYQSADGVLNGPEAVEAMEWFQSLFDNGYANAEPAGDDDFYGTKKAALAFVGHWMWTPHSEGLGDDLVLLPMPKFGDKAATGMGSWNWGITSHSEHPEAAWKFLEFLVDPDEILHMTNANGAVPARKSALAKSDLFGEGGPLNVFVQQLEGGVAIPRPITPAYPTITESFAEAVQNIVTGADVQAELDKIVKKIDQDIEDNQGYPVPGAPPPEPKAEGEPVTINVWFHSGKGEERDVLDAQVETFNNMQNEVFVDAVRLPEGSYNEQVSAAALAGDLPDLLDFDGPFLYNYAWAGHLMPIDEFVSDDLKNDFLPSIIDQGTYGGNLYSLGTFDSGLAIWGNKAYLEKAGVRIPTGVDDAWSLDEFNDALEKLQALDEVEYAIDLKMNYGQGEWYTYGFSPILQSWGGDLIDRSDYQSADGVLNGPEAVEAMEWFQSLFDNGYANAEPAGDDDFYGTKKAALAFVGHWMWTPHSEGLGDDLVLLPMPKFGDEAATGMGSWNWGITSHSEHPEAAWKFLEFLVDPDEILHMTNANGAVPARKSALAKSDLFGEGGPLNVFVQQLEGGVAIPRPITPAYPTITESFAEAVQNIVTGADVQAELDKIVKKIDQDIEDNQGYPSP